MRTTPLALLTLFHFVLVSCATGEAREESRPEGRKPVYHALLYQPPSAGTWAILQRDGANREVAPYLSSLGGGELGTGTIRSPEFPVSTASIAFTVCGHDGQAGGQGENLVALVDTRSGDVLRSTPAPGADPMQERSWDVADLMGRPVRIEVRDGIAAGGFAWIGIGRIDAGEGGSVDFAKGLPDGWESPPSQARPSLEAIGGGVPFLALRRTMFPSAGEATIPCGFEARRIFFLGCTVPTGKPLDVAGAIEIAYAAGPPERFPLMVGFTLEKDHKLPSRSSALYIRPSVDPFQYILVVSPRSQTIDHIRLVKEAGSAGTPRITAITCEGVSKAAAIPEAGGGSEGLELLPSVGPSPEETAWIESHTLRPGRPDPARIVAEIRRANRIPASP